MGWELRNSGAVGVETANRRQGRPGSGLWDIKMLKPRKIPTPKTPKRVCLPSPFLVGLQSEPIIVCILVVLHILKAENEVFERKVEAKGSPSSLKRKACNYFLS